MNQGAQPGPAILPDHKACVLLAGHHARLHVLTYFASSGGSHGFTDSMACITYGRLTASPELVNSAPYGDGWVVRLRPARKDDVEQLLDAAAYRRTLER